MVTRETFPNEPPGFDSEDSAMVIDLGEGQTVDTAGTSFKGSVQARFWHAPEIQSLRSWSIASDIFAFAVAACTLLESEKTCVPNRRRRTYWSEQG
jgi:hypothetical protein